MIVMSKKDDLLMALNNAIDALPKVEAEAAAAEVVVEAEAVEAPNVSSVVSSILSRVLRRVLKV